MDKVVDFYNKKLSKKGLVLLVGKKAFWLEIWKARLLETNQRPVISLTGAEPILNYTEESLREAILNRKKELEQVYKTRYNQR